MSDFNEAVNRCNMWTEGVLNLSFLNLYYLPKLPIGITELNISNNKFRNIPLLPLTIKRLNISYIT